MNSKWGAAAVAVAMGWCAPAAAQQMAAPAADAAQYPEMSPAETVWHLRAALNVAALGCRGAQETAMVAGYNALLASERAALAAAADGTAARYKARYGAAWQARFDDDMTRLYNFWARPTAHDEFCVAADGVLRDAAVVEPAEFGAFAAAALPRLAQLFAPAEVAPAPVVVVAAEPAIAPAPAPRMEIAAASPIAIGPAAQ